MDTSENETNQLKAVQEMVQCCIQCGTCSGSCPNEFAMDFTPRHLWQMVLSGDTNTIFQSKTFSLCSACYYCTLRCPRGLPLTEAMSALKQIASRENIKKYRSSSLFYKKFMESVRRHGRVRETEFMTLYFSAMKHPFLPLRFAPLGTKLLMKKKISMELPSKGTRKLDALIKKVEKLEDEA
ncbi:MAG: 4Fe-4S dicluster domain-containing protein [Desulfobacteraceae bacterium]